MPIGVLILNKYFFCIADLEYHSTCYYFLMQFLLIAYDGTDEKALERRLSSRQAHIDYSNKLKENGNMIFGAAILDKNEKMIGSAIVYEFPSREELDSCLRKEPYVTNKVWQKIEIKSCKVGPSFINDFKALSNKQ